MINPMDLGGRVILVTGASSGIGRATCILLSQLGARLVLVARNNDRLAQTQSLLEGSGHHIKPFDLNQIDQIPPWLKTVADEVGKLHGLVHSAGIQITLPVRLLSARHMEEIMRINVNAGIGLVRAFSQNQISYEGSSIVFLSSVMGIVGQPGLTAYSASKGALIALTKSLALELAREGRRVNTVAPAFVKTEMAGKLQDMLTPEQFAAVEAMHPLGMGTPLDVANAIAFLLADTGRWITGTTLVVDGGYTAH